MPIWYNHHTPSDVERSVEQEVGVERALTSTVDAGETVAVTLVRTVGVDHSVGSLLRFARSIDESVEVERALALGGDAGQTVSAELLRTLAAEHSVGTALRLQRGTAEQVDVERKGTFSVVQGTGASAHLLRTIAATHNVGKNLISPYSHDFHTGGVSVSASACTGVECETNTTAPSETDSTASGAQGAALTVTIPVGTMTLNATGTVTVEELDSGGSVLDTHTESWGTAAEGQTLTMDFTGDPNVQQMRVEAELTADSQNASGGGSCSSDADCTDETAQIASAITISE